MLSEEQFARRYGKCTASRLPMLMSAKDSSQLVRAWRIDLQLEPPEPENWQMVRGLAHGKRDPHWRVRVTGNPVTRCGEIVDHPEFPDSICCTLDGYRAADDCVIEIKFLGAFQRRDYFLPYYYPQVAMQMLCTGAKRGALVVAQGNADPVEYEIDRGAGFDAYVPEMVKRALAYSICLKTLTPPAILPPVIPPEKWRTVDLSIEATNWGAELEQHLQDFAATAEAADQHEAAGTAARALVPDDVGRVLAGPWQLNRNKKGVISITTRRTA